MTWPAEVLVHERVTLRRWRRADAETVFEAVRESLDHLRPWMPWAAGYGPADAVEFTASCERDWESGDAYNYAVTTAGVTVGSCGLMRRSGPTGLEIGYWLHPDHTGRGLASMSTIALVDAALTLPGVDHVEISHDARNAASEAVPRRLGFIEVERRARQRPHLSGEVGTDVVWRLTKKDLRARFPRHSPTPFTQPPWQLPRDCCTDR
jgi:ribosomal-protein-serine acetyltransferase